MINNIIRGIRRLLGGQKRIGQAYKEPYNLEINTPSDTEFRGGFWPCGSMSYEIDEEDETKDPLEKAAMMGSALASLDIVGEKPTYEQLLEFHTLAHELLTDAYWEEVLSREKKDDKANAEG